MNIQGGDYTNTFMNFNFFMNTREYKCLAFGPGVIDGGACGHPTEFIIQARNDHDENRRSGRDHFEVKITTVEDKPQLIDAELIDNDDGTYLVKYQVDEPHDVKIDITFENEKQKMVPIRGSPYSSSFNEKTNSNNNQLLGPAMSKYISSSLEEIADFISTTSKGINLKDKDIENDVKQLISVKEHVENVQIKNDEMIFWLDCVDESLKLFQKNEKAKESQLKAIKKAFDNWHHLKKAAKETKKDIASNVENEKEKTKAMIKKLEDDLKTYTNELKKREFYYYKTGPDESQKKLGGVNEEIIIFKEKIEDYGFNAERFGAPELIESSKASVENIETEVESMNILWDHIKLCQGNFKGYMATKWLETQPYDMEEEVKRLQKTTKDIKVDRRCNAYMGLMNDIKSWLQFLPLIAELRDDAMRERHWAALKKEIKQDFNVDDKLTLKDVYGLNLNQQAEAVEEITDQAKQEARMEKTLNKLEEIYSQVEFETHQHKNTDVYLLKMLEDDFEQLEENQVAVNAMFSSRFLSTFEDR